MHLLLTDILACPRCGPEFGLILLARDLRDRRIHSGWLGCANCRDRYLVHDGFGDFRAPADAPPASRATAGPGPAAGGAGPSAGADAAAVRIAALLGLTDGGGYALIAGPGARHGGDVARLVEGLEIVAADPNLSAESETPGVSRIAVDRRLPFYSARLRGVWLSGDAADTLLEEALRVVQRGGRVVLDGAPADAEQRLERAGFAVRAREGDTLLAVRA
jgi:uncharacterized protein YbaR (Trm112 family)